MQRQFTAVSKSPQKYEKMKDYLIKKFALLLGISESELAAAFDCYVEDNIIEIAEA